MIFLDTTHFSSYYIYHAIDECYTFLKSTIMGLRLIDWKTSECISFLGFLWLFFSCEIGFQMGLSFRQCGCISTHFTHVTDLKRLISRKWMHDFPTIRLLQVFMRVIFWSMRVGKSNQKVRIHSNRINWMLNR